MIKDTTVKTSGKHCLCGFDGAAAQEPTAQRGDPADLWRMARRKRGCDPGDVHSASVGPGPRSAEAALCPAGELMLVP